MIKLIMILSLFGIFLFVCCYYNLFLSDRTILHSNIIYQHISIRTIDWRTFYSITSGLSLIIYLILYLYVPKKLNFNSRWFTFLKKFNGTNLSSNHERYTIVIVIRLLIAINNLYRIISFNWAPSTQYWFILMITTMFLFSIWLTIIIYGGIKLFGQIVPIRWYFINFTIWIFHNLRFFIRFISLPFRMIINLIVGCFLVEFVKSNFRITSFIRIYELFVITVQSIVFIILCNMYYVEIMIIPEWKQHQSNYSYLPSLKFKPAIKFLILFTINIFKK